MQPFHDISSHYYKPSKRKVTQSEEQQTQTDNRAAMPSMLNACHAIPMHVPFFPQCNL
jgi:hypothetical protein